MEELTNIEELNIKVEERVRENPFCLIAIDGVDGCGKTTIANDLSTNLNLKHFELHNDRYLYKQKGGYVDFIKYDVLRNDLQEVQEQNSAAIIDGICVLEILYREGFIPTLHIYIKRLVVGLWLDGKHFNYTSTIEKELLKDQKELEEFSEINALITGKKEKYDNSGKGIFHEQLNYHFKFRPDEKANLLYTWEG